MPNVKVKNNETLLDVAVLASGDVGAMIELALINNVSLTKDFTSGDSIITGTVLNADNVNQLTARKARPASAIVAGENGILEGIDYWAIWKDFIVQ